MCQTQNTKSAYNSQINAQRQREAKKQGKKKKEKEIKKWMLETESLAFLSSPKGSASQDPCSLK